MSSQILDGLQQHRRFFSEQCDSCVASHTQESSDCVCLVVVIESERLAITLINPPTDSARVVLFLCERLASLLVTAKQLAMNTPAITTLATVSISGLRSLVEVIDRLLFLADDAYQRINRLLRRLLIRTRRFRSGRRRVCLSQGVRDMTEGWHEPLALVVIR